MIRLQRIIIQFIYLCLHSPFHQRNAGFIRHDLTYRMATSSLLKRPSGLSSEKTNEGGIQFSNSTLKRKTAHRERPSERTNFLVLSKPLCDKGYVHFRGKAKYTQEQKRVKRVPHVMPCRTGVPKDG